MTICDLCLKENRPLYPYEVSVVTQWPLEKQAISKDRLLLCNDCRDKIIADGLFHIIKEYFNKHV